MNNIINWAKYNFLYRTFSFVNDKSKIFNQFVA